MSDAREVRHQFPAGSFLACRQKFLVKSSSLPGSNVLLVLCMERQHSLIGLRLRRKEVSSRATGAFPVDHVPAAPRLIKSSTRGRRIVRPENSGIAVHLPNNELLLAVLFL